MYEFHHYNPAHPQIITSFKGNQKLILGGYRYNIHHVKEGVKTWRCVCAKKLTGARSWCKGRAETWDSDSKGIPKGEHNHQTEHDLAELEYFKSQLIFAAIAEPQADLNALMDEASKFLSQGLSFGNRESMKKSLIVARKSAESGELKLGQQPHRSTLKGVRKSCVRSSKGTALAHQQSNGQISTKSSTATKSGGSTTPAKTSGAIPTSVTPSANKVAGNGKQFTSSTTTTTSSSFLLNSSAGSSSGLGSELSDSPAGQSWTQQLADLSAASAAGMGGMLEGGVGGGNNSDVGMVNGIGSAVTLGASNEQLLAAAIFAAAMLGSSQTQPGHQTGSSSHSQQRKTGLTNGIASSSTSGTQRAAGSSHQQQHQAPMAASSSPATTPAASANNAKRKSARVNGILQKLSNKAAAESSVSPSPPLQIAQEQEKQQQQETAMDTTEISNNNHKQQQKEEGNHNNIQKPQAKRMVSTETQTEEEEPTAAGRKRRHQQQEDNGEKEWHQMNGAGNEENAVEKLNGQCCQPKIICCCCCDDEAELNANEVPLGCKKRAKLQSMPKRREKAEDDGEAEASNNMDQQPSPSTGELFMLEQELKLEIVDDEEEEEDEEDGVAKEEDGQKKIHQ